MKKVSIEWFEQIFYIHLWDLNGKTVLTPLNKTGMFKTCIGEIHKFRVGPGQTSKWSHHSQKMSNGFSLTGPSCTMLARVRLCLYLTISERTLFLWSESCLNKLPLMSDPCETIFFESICDLYFLRWNAFLLITASHIYKEINLTLLSLKNTKFLLYK